MIRENGQMLDTHAVARSLTAADFTPAQADAITAAVRQAAEHGDHVTTDQFNAALAALEARLTWRFAGAMAAQTIAIIGAVAALMRMFAGAN